jgi:hypothetical protein
MPENVTGFQPTGNLKKSLIDLAYFDMLPRRSPTFFREEPNGKSWCPQCPDNSMKSRSHFLLRFSRRVRN